MIAVSEKLAYNYVIRVVAEVNHLRSVNFQPDKLRQHTISLAVKLTETTLNPG